MPRKTLIVALYLIVGFLLAANLYVVYAETTLNKGYDFGWRFYFDRRLNFPFYFSLFLSLFNLALLFEICRDASLSKPQSKFWKTLFITFLIFTIDGAFYIHQHFKMSTFGRIASYDRTSLTHYLWVIPYFLVFGALFIILYRYAFAIPSQVRKRILVAGFIFLTGAVAMEFAGTYYAVIKPGRDIILLSIKTAESVLQMVGAVMFIDTFFTVRRDLMHNESTIKQQ